MRVFCPRCRVFPEAPVFKEWLDPAVERQRYQRLESSYQRVEMVHDDGCVLGRGSGSDRLVANPSPGATIVNGDDGRTRDLLTDQKFGDAEIYLEFLIPQKSNSGLYVTRLVRNSDP